MSQKPNVIIFGGLYGMTQEILRHLVSHPNKELVAHVRVRDKPSISPPTTYMGGDFLELLEERKDIIDYKQANLENPDTVDQGFQEAAPNGGSYTHILDFTGNYAYYHPASLQIAQTFNVGLNIARAAQKYGVKSIVRLQPPWYEHLDPMAKYKEEDEAGWKPMGTKGVWWHETLKAMGDIPGLPFCVVRCAYAYGPDLYQTEPLTAVVIGYVYKHLGEEIRIPWTPELRKNTIHSSDLAVAMWKVSEWMATTGRERANSMVGVELSSTNAVEISSVPGTISYKDVIVPVFHAVDDGDTTQQVMAEEIANVFGIQAQFSRGEEWDMQGMSVNDFMEHINNVHVGEWAKIIINSNPAVPNTPLTPYTHAFHIKEHGCALDGSKLKEICSFQPKHPRFDASSIRLWIQWCRQQGIWPESPLYSP